MPPVGRFRADRSAKRRRSTNAAEFPEMSARKLAAARFAVMLKTIRSKYFK
jgi:hypothetical protein